MRPGEKILLGALLLLAGLLRFGGMSHDLHAGFYYHPDSPKQIRAIQRYYSGRYYWHTGLKDYDGYPLFHAHMAEYFLRVAEPVRVGVSNLLGLTPHKRVLLRERNLYWLMFTMNAALSTLIVLIVFRAGRETFGPTAGWIAAVLAALSPADITSAHLATGDVATAFFAALSLLWALRVHRLGRYRDYALAAIFATFAFAAKYYAATAFFALALAHITRTGTLRPAAWFSPDALRRIGVAAAATLVALVVAIPALVTDFTAEVADIWVALMHSTQRYPASMLHADKWERFLYSMRVNVPDFIRCISPAGLAAALVACVGPLRRDARVWILVIGPVLYIFLAVGSRGLVNPVYHTDATPQLFLLTAFCAVWALGVGGRLRLASRALAVAALTAALALFAVDAARETFFALHMDARRISATWADENVPPALPKRGGRYTFHRPRLDRPESPSPGFLFVSSGLDPITPQAGSIPVKRIDFERSPMTQFRNIRQDLYIYCPDLLRAGFSLPVGQRWPSQIGNALVADNGAEFLRSEKTIILEPGDQVRRWIVKNQPLAEAWIIARSTRTPASVRVSFAGRDEILRFETNTAAMVRIANPRPGFPSRADLRFYPLKIGSPSARLRVSLATRPAEAGRLLANLGRHAEAAPLLAAGAEADGDRAAAAQALISAGLAGLAWPPDLAGRLAQLAAPVRSVADDASLFAAYGIHRAYLDDLPFLELSAGQLEYEEPAGSEPNPSARDAEAAVDFTAATRAEPQIPSAFVAVGASDLLLDAGCYQARFHLRAPGGLPPGRTMRLVLRDERDRILLERDLAVPPPDARTAIVMPFDFTLPPGVAACSVSLHTGLMLDCAESGLDIRPDPLANARALGAALQAADAVAREQAGDVRSARNP